MYITFFQDKRPKFIQMNFEDLLANPYQDIPEGYEDIQTYKVTYDVPEHVAKNYFEKHLKNHYACSKENLIIPPCTVDEIPKFYRHFQIPKRTDPRKKRDIDTPTGTPLATYQSTWKGIIENQFHVLMHDAAHGYVTGRSTVTERQVHQKHGSKWFLYLDLKDFFPSHNKKYCMEMLKHIYPFGAILDTEIGKKNIENMVDYALLKDSLPQGTPLSPTLTNVLMMPIDTDITNALRDFDRKNFKYTRYADDITISCRQKFNPQKIIREINKILKKWNTPFKLNTAKIKFGSSAGKNYHLGTIINKDNELKLGHKKNQRLRAAIFQYGQAHIAGNEEVDLHKLQVLLGNISYAKSIDPDYIKHVLQKYSDKFGTNIERHMIQKLNGPNQF